MSHLVLSRKYRPRLFDEVVGQDLIISTLKKAVIKNRLAHAFLFTGTRGVGKTTIARILAKAMVCDDIKDGEPCNACPNCTGIDNFSSLDVMEIDGASHTSVDDIRVLRENSRYQPSHARYKIFIIDEVHMLSQSAFNALLKILEEPPPHIRFIFATTESHKIPKTILSRCQRYDFKRVFEEVIFNNLKGILAKEGVKNFDDDALKLIAKLGDGSLRDAQSLAEQVLSMGENNYTETMVADILGVVDHKAIKDLAFHIINAQTESSIKIIKSIYEVGLDMGNLLEGLIARFRLLSLCCHLPDFKSAIQIEPFISEEDFFYANSLEKNDLRRLFSLILDASTKVFQAKNPLFAMELLVLELALRPPLKEAYQIGQLLTRLENLLRNKGSLTSEKISKPELLKLDSSGDPFERLTKSLEKSMPRMTSALRLARPKIDNEKKLIKLYFDKQFYLEEAQEQQNNPIVLTAIKNIFRQDYSFEFHLIGAEENIAIKNLAEITKESQELEQKNLRIKAENHPLVKQALDILGGSITNITKIETHEII